MTMMEKKEEERRRRKKSKGGCGTVKEDNLDASLSLCFLNFFSSLSPFSYHFIPIFYWLVLDGTLVSFLVWYQSNGGLICISLKIQNFESNFIVQ